MAKSVWVIMQIDAEPYESMLDGIHNIYSNPKDAWEYYNNNRGRLGTESYDDDTGNVYGGYYLREPKEWPVLS